MLQEKKPGWRKLPDPGGDRATLATRAETAKSSITRPRRRQPENTYRFIHDRRRYRAFLRQRLRRRDFPDPSGAGATDNQLLASVATEVDTAQLLRPGETA